MGWKEFTLLLFVVSSVWDARMSALMQNYKDAVIMCGRKEGARVPGMIHEVDIVALGNHGMLHKI